MKKIGNIIARYPLVTFLLALVILFAIIAGSSSLRKEAQNEEEEVHAQPRSVAVFDESAKHAIKVLAEVDRADTITLIATKSGVINRIAKEGEYVYHGAEIAYTADTYSGTSVASTSAAIAKGALAHQEEIHSDQEKILEIREESINKTDRDEVKIARKQISLEEKANDFNLNNAKLNWEQAQANAALASTTAPFTGYIQSIFVRVGDSVSQGQALAVLQAENQADAQLVAYVGKERAARLSLTGRTYAEINGVQVDLEVVYIATAPTKAGAYAVTLKVKDPQSEVDIADGMYVTVHLSLVQDEEGERMIPLDAVRYGSTGPEVFIIEGDSAQSVAVTLGPVVGAMISVTQGLATEDVIILDRSVTVGERVVAAQ